MKVRVLCRNFGYKNGIYDYGAVIDMDDADFPANFNSVVQVKEEMPEPKKQEVKPVNPIKTNKRGL